MGLPRPTDQENLLAGVSLLVDELQRRGLGNIKIKLGTAVFHWSATVAGSDALAIPHGLRIVPRWYTVFVEGLGNPLFAYATAAADATNLNVQAWDPAGAVGIGTNRNAFWAAIA